MSKPITTIANVYVSSTIEIDKSLFIAHCIRTDTSQQAMSFVEQISKKYCDATHNCYAFVCQDGSRYNDDGEPQGTAGMPIREVIVKNSLTNVCVVVTRYFGGIKLGAGGLIRAYTNSAAAVLSNAQRVVLKNCDKLSITVAYPYTKAVSMLLSSMCNIHDTIYQTAVTYIVAIEGQAIDTLVQKLEAVCSNNYTLEHIGSSQEEVQVNT